MGATIPEATSPPISSRFGSVPEPYMPSKQGKEVKPSSGHCNEHDDLTFLQLKFLFSLCCNPPSDTSAAPSPRRLPFLYFYKNNSEVRQRRGLGEENWLGRGEVDREKTRRKRTRRNKWATMTTIQKAADVWKKDVSDFQVFPRHF